MSGFFGKYNGFDELIFENRNQDYGAYRLRKNYNRSVILGLLIASFLFSSLTFLPFLLSKNKTVLSIKKVEIAIPLIQPELLKFPVEEKPKPSEGKPDPPQAKPDLVQVAENKPEIHDSGQSVKTSNKNEESIIPGSENSLFVNETKGFIVSDSVPPVNSTPKSADIEGFREWLQSNVNYPDSALINGISGKVTVAFVIENDGSISDVNILKGVNKIIDEEAIKTIKSSPKWMPDHPNRKTGRARYQITLLFQIADT